MQAGEGDGRLEGCMPAFPGESTDVSLSYNVKKAVTNLQGSVLWTQMDLWGRGEISGVWVPLEDGT